MSLNLALFIFLMLISIYAIVIEIFTVIFRLTGISAETAHFQSVSLLTNAGFTSSESEIMLVTRIRRRIAKVAMIFGYMFSVVIASSIINLIMTITAQDSTSDKEMFTNVAIVASFIVAMLGFGKLSFLKKNLDKAIEFFVNKAFMSKAMTNPYYILETYGKEILCELLVTKVPEIIEGKTIIQSNIRYEYGISILAISRNGEHKAVDATTDLIQVDDKIVLFGKRSAINKLFRTLKHS